MNSMINLLDRAWKSLSDPNVQKAMQSAARAFSIMARHFKEEEARKIEEARLNLAEAEKAQDLLNKKILQTRNLEAKLALEKEQQLCKDAYEKCKREYDELVRLHRDPKS